MDHVYNTRKRQVSEDETPPVKKGCPKVVCVPACYPPITYDDNDEIANSRNLEALKKVMERGKPRKEFVLSLMKETFTSWREVILSDTTTSVAIIVEKQGALSLPFTVSDKVY